MRQRVLQALALQKRLCRIVRPHGACACGASCAEMQAAFVLSVRFPHPSRYSLDTFSRLGEGFYSCVLSSCETALPYKCTQLCPRGTPMQSAQGWRSQTEGEKQEANGGKLAFIRAVQAFSCRGASRAAFPFHPISFHGETQVLCFFLDSRKKRSSPSLSHTAAAACLIAETCGCFFARNA